MRKMLVLLAGVVVAAALSGSPAKAEMGCACVKLGQTATCVSGVNECMNKVGGACLMICDYQAPKKAMMSKKKKMKKSS
jgi:hypothetical protein